MQQKAEPHPGILDGAIEILIADVSELKTVLESSGSTQNALLDAINRLRKHGELPPRVLSETLIGKSVNKLAKTSSFEIVSSSASELVSSWRQSHRKRKAETAASDASISHVLPAAESSREFVHVTTDASSGPSEETLHVAAAGQSELKAAPQITRDSQDEKITPQRAKVRMKFKEALSDSGAIDTADHEIERNKMFSIASGIEAALWAEFEEKEKDYMNQARAILFNLKDKQNPTFRSAVLAGQISVASMAKMTSADMASATKKEERKKADEADKARQENIRDVLIAMGKAKGVPPTPPPSALKSR